MEEQRGDWVKCRQVNSDNEETEPYYYNVATQETQWEPPEEFRDTDAPVDLSIHLPLDCLTNCFYYSELCIKTCGKGIQGPSRVHEGDRTRQARTCEAQFCSTAL